MSRANDSNKRNSATLEEAGQDDSGQPCPPPDHHRTRKRPKETEPIPTPPQPEPPPSLQGKSNSKLKQKRAPPKSEHRQPKKSRTSKSTSPSHTPEAQVLQPVAGHEAGSGRNSNHTSTRTSSTSNPPLPSMREAPDPIAHGERGQPALKASVAAEALASNEPDTAGHIHTQDPPAHPSNTAESAPTMEPAHSRHSEPAHSRHSEPTHSRQSEPRPPEPSERLSRPSAPEPANDQEASHTVYVKQPWHPWHAMNVRSLRSVDIMLIHDILISTGIVIDENATCIIECLRELSIYMTLNLANTSVAHDKIIAMYRAFAIEADPYSEATGAISTRSKVANNCKSKRKSQRIIDREESLQEKEIADMKSRAKLRGIKRSMSSLVCISEDELRVRIFRVRWHLGRCWRYCAGCAKILAARDTRSLNSASIKHNKSCVACEDAAIVARVAHAQWLRECGHLEPDEVPLKWLELSQKLVAKAYSAKYTPPSESLLAKLPLIILPEGQHSKWQAFWQHHQHNPRPITPRRPAALARPAAPHAGSDAQGKGSLYESVPTLLPPPHVASAAVEAAPASDTGKASFDMVLSIISTIISTVALIAQTGTAKLSVVAKHIPVLQASGQGRAPNPEAAARQPRSCCSSSTPPSPPAPPDSPLAHTSPPAPTTPKPKSESQGASQAKTQASPASHASHAPPVKTPTLTVPFDETSNRITRAARWKEAKLEVARRASAKANLTPATSLPAPTTTASQVKSHASQTSHASQAKSHASKPSRSEIPTHTVPQADISSPGTHTHAARSTTQHNDTGHIPTRPTHKIKPTLPQYLSNLTPTRPQLRLAAPPHTTDAPTSNAAVLQQQPHTPTSNKPTATPEDTIPTTPATQATHNPHHQKQSPDLRIAAGFLRHSAPFGHNSTHQNPAQVPTSKPAKTSQDKSHRTANKTNPTATSIPHPSLPLQALPNSPNVTAVLAEPPTAMEITPTPPRTWNERSPETS